MFHVKMSNMFHFVRFDLYLVFVEAQGCGLDGQHDGCLAPHPRALTRPLGRSCCCVGCGSRWRGENNSLDCKRH